MMNVQKTKSQEAKGKPVAHLGLQKQINNQMDSQLEVRQPEIIAQRKLQELADNSQLVKKSTVFQTIADMHTANFPIQRVLFAPSTGDIAGWNTILGHINILHAAHTLPNKAAIDNFVLQAEGDWEGDLDHSASVMQFNAKVTIKGMINDGLEDLRLAPADSANLGWNDIVDYLNDEVDDKGFITVASAHGPLPGGHGNGVAWNASDGTSGTIPDAAHGRGAGALGGARGNVRTVIIAHNAAITAAQGVAAAL